MTGLTTHTLQVLIEHWEIEISHAPDERGWDEDAEKRMNEILKELKEELLLKQPPKPPKWHDWPVPPEYTMSRISDDQLKKDLIEWRLDTSFGDGLERGYVTEGGGLDFEAISDMTRQAMIAELLMWDDYDCPGMGFDDWCEEHIDGHGQTKYRVIIWTVDPDTGVKTIGNIGEWDTIQLAREYEKAQKKRFVEDRRSFEASIQLIDAEPRHDY